MSESIDGTAGGKDTVRGRAASFASEEDGIAVHVLTDTQCDAFQALTDRLYDPEDPDHQDWFADCTPEWVEQFRPS